MDVIKIKKNLLKTAYNLIGFIVGFGVTFAIEMVLLWAIRELFGSRINLGIGGIIIPVIAGTGFAKMFPDIIRAFPNMLRFCVAFFNILSIPAKIIVIFPFIWGAIYSFYVYLFEPYGYMKSKVILFPTFVLYFLYFIYLKLKPSNN